MAAADAKEASAPAPEAPEKAEDAAPVAGERPEKVAMPDRDAFDRKVAALKDLMNANKREKAAIQRRLDSSRGAEASGASKEFSDALAKKKAIRNEFNELKAKAQALIDRQNKLREARTAAATALREGRSAMTPEDIERRMQDIEDELKSEGHRLSLREEKDLIKQRSELARKLREAGSSARSRGDLEAAKKAAETDLDALRDAITEAKARQREALERLKAYDEVVNKAKAAKDAERAGTGDLRGRLRELSEKNNAAYKELKEAETAHYAQLKKAYAYRDWERARRKAEYEARRRAEEAERAGEDEKAKADEEASKPDHPWAVELVELDMLAHYLRAAAPEAAEGGAAAGAGEVASGSGAAYEAKAGAALMGLGLGEAPKARGKRRKGRKGKAGAGHRELTFDLATLGMFAKFGIEPPLSVEDAKEAMATVAAKHAEYESKPPKASKTAAPAEGDAGAEAAPAPADEA